MFGGKYNKFLTIILIIIIIAIIILLGFLGYDYYQKYFISQEASDFVDDFHGDYNQEIIQDNNVVENNNQEDPLSKIQNTNSNSSKISNKKQYKGFWALGTMEIPKTNFKYPVLEKVTKKSIETAVAVLYGAGLNQPGNTVIVGHNYRNGLFFSNNKKLVNGDKIYITDYSGGKMTYTIYNKFETTPEDTSFYQRDTNGIPEITLSTCTDDSSARLIIFAKAN